MLSLISLIQGGFDTLVVVELDLGNVIVHQIPQRLKDNPESIFSPFRAVADRYIYVRYSSNFAEFGIPVSLSKELDMQSFHRWLRKTVKKLRKLAEEVNNDNNWNVNSKSIVKEVEIYDLMGRKIYEGELKDIRSLNLKRGIYFIKRGNEVEKVVIR